MSAALCVTLFVLAPVPEAPPRTPVEAPRVTTPQKPPQYMIQMRLYRGSMPAVGRVSSKLLAEPSLMTPAGSPARLFTGGEKRVLRRGGEVETLRWGVKMTGVFTPAARSLVHVDAALAASGLAVDGRPESDYQVVPLGAVRFVGTVPIGESFRFAGDGVWAEVRVDQP